jgi:hypothetical protein
VLWSLVGMLIYIWFRFEIQYGVGATGDDSRRHGDVGCSPWASE